MIPTNNITNAGQVPIAAKWFGLVNDIIIPLPSRRVSATVLRTQASVPPGDTLFRDHDSPEDEVVREAVEIDLGLGNVFYSEECGCAGKDAACAQPAKLAFAVDDRPEITIRRDQTGNSIRELFGVGMGRALLRDYESPHDKIIAEDEPVLFGDGPVFITRPLAEYCINIEGKVYPWDAPTITVAQIRALGGLPADQSVVVEDGEGHERTLGNDEVVHLSECCRVGRAPKYKRG
jgi:hypothetical protein